MGLLFDADRLMHQTYAKLNGYFWLPCPVCQKMFGGHEVGQWESLKTSNHGGRVVCSEECGVIASQINERNGFPNFYPRVNP